MYLTRSIQIRRQGIDLEARTVPATIATDAAIYDHNTRRPWILRHDAGANTAALVEKYKPAVDTLIVSGEHRAGAGDTSWEDRVEALVGAVYLDGGAEAARRCFLPLLEQAIQRAAAEPRKDAKTALQEMVQKVGARLPEYQIIEQSGHAHAPEFTVECRLQDGALIGRGQGPDRRSAEQAAAQDVLEQRQALAELGLD